MASLPRKGIKGENFKAWAVDSINKLIDYLSSPYLQPGKGLNIRRTPSGTIIELQKQVAVAQNSSGGSVVATGFPNFFTRSFIVVNDNGSYTITENMWLIGRVQCTAASVSDASLYLNYVRTGSSSTPAQIKLFMADTDSVYRENFICMPIPSGLTISFSKDDIGISFSAILYPCQ